MKTRNLLLCLALLSLSVAAKAETRLNVRGGLSLVNNDITAINTQSIQNEDSYSGFFVGPALTMEAKRLFGLDFGVIYAKNNMKGFDQNGIETKYSQEFIDVPLSLRLHIGFKNLCIIGQFGPQWNFNIGDVQKFFNNGEEIDGKKIVTTANLGAGVRLFNKVEAMVNFNCPWECVGDHFDDFQKMGDLIGDYKTVQFVLAWRFGHGK